MKIELTSEIIILTGAVGTGKSAALLKWVNGKPVCGFITPTINCKKVFFDISLNKYYPYELEKASENSVGIGKYFLSKEAFQLAENIVKDFLKDSSYCFVFDEIGKLELKCEGHYKSLIRLLNNRHRKLLLVIREQLLDDVIRTFELADYKIINKDQLSSFSF